MLNEILSCEQSRALINVLETIWCHNFDLKAEVGIEIEFYLYNYLNIEKFATLYGYSIIPELGKNQYEINLKPSADLILVCDNFIVIRINFYLLQLAWTS